MTLACPDCDGHDVELVSDNGAAYPQTRIEYFRCHHCGETFRNVLAA